MAETTAEYSTAVSTAANADTLKLELKKMLTEILSYGGGETKDRGETDGSSGVLSAIDAAVRILNRLREVESKKMPESDDIPSSSSPSPKEVEVPKEFICTLSNKIMIEPVIIASGQTYEKRYITQWLKHEDTCPKSEAVLSHSLWMPNHLLDELITKWCIANEYDRLKPPDEVVTELSKDGIDSLLQRISSPSSAEDQREAAKELRCQTKIFPNVRHFFLSLRPYSITQLISPLSALSVWVSPHPELEEDIITALYHISTFLENIKEISREDVISVLTKSLRQGTLETQRKSAATLLSLFAIDSNKRIIGNPETLGALTEVISQSDFVASLEAASVVVNVCLESENREKAISARLVPVLIRKIKAGNNVREFLFLLALLSGHERGIEEMEKDKEFIKYLFSILRKRSCSINCESAVVIFHNMCNLAAPHSNRVRTRRVTVIDEEENQYGTFTMLTKQGSEHVVQIATTILEWLKTNGTGKDPQMD